MKPAPVCLHDCAIMKSFSGNMKHKGLSRRQRGELKVEQQLQENLTEPERRWKTDDVDQTMNGKGEEGSDGARDTLVK